MTGFDRSHPNFDPNDARKQYVYYNPQTGDIVGSSCHSALAPKHPHMIVEAPWISLEGMKVNLQTKKLEAVVYSDASLRGLMQKYSLADILLGIQSRDKKLFKAVDKVQDILAVKTALPPDTE
jgi:uncharacterized protein YbbC (DUF1343 family)